MTTKALRKTPSHEARAHILAAALGVAVTIALEESVKHGWDWPRIIALSAFVITAVIFTIAMIQVAQDTEYVGWLAQHHWWAAYDLLSDVVTAVLLIVMAFNLDTPRGLIITNVLFRFVDAAAEFLVVGRVKNSLAGTWIYIDSIGIGSFCLAAMVLSIFHVEGAARMWVVSVVFLVSTLINTAIDVWKNGALYFDTPEAAGESTA